ncbi:MAG TPA: response regulator [Holophagaceae bacterium]
MSRLLLVDDNPSIHRIAESLLAPTDVELVCVDSAAEALDRISRGERFDVALVDTAMPGMDGWTLLSRLRANEATAAMPIALMAGVLDPVDPSKLAKAPVQGFLKKPIELRELGDRVKALLATPVVPPAAPSPFSTVPATPAADLVQRANAALPEYRPEPSALSEPEPQPHPGPGPMAPAEAEDDLLVLTPDDLWPEEAAPEVAVPAVPEPLPEVHLELEELDLESLQDLGVETTAPAAVGVPEPFPDDTLVTLSGLEELDLGPVAAEASAPAGSMVEELELEPLDADLDLAPLEDLPVALPPFAAAPEGAQEPAPVHLEPEPAVPAAALMAPHVHVPDSFEAPEAPAPPEAAVGGQAPAVPGQVPADLTGPAASAQAVVQAILGDPVLVDALVRAVVARMGDQTIREIAWEVIPDLAGRLHS